LASALIEIILVDAEGVDPDPPRPVTVAQSLESGTEIWCDGYSLVMAENINRALGRAPDI
jgi:hypothetical protein